MNFLADYCCCSVIKSCPILCDCVDCSLPGSSGHGISQAKHWCGLGTSTSRASSWPDPGINPCLLHLQVGSLSNEPSEKPLLADWTLKNKNQWTDICASRNNPDCNTESKAYWGKKILLSYYRYCLLWPSSIEDWQMAGTDVGGANSLEYISSCLSSLARVAPSPSLRL